MDRSAKNRKLSLYKAVIALPLASVMAGFCLFSSPVYAVEESVSQAKQLQLEATRLQLKGDLENALKKYKQSLALTPNARLEKVVARLEERVNKTAIASKESLEHDAAKESSTQETSAGLSLVKNVQTIINPAATREKESTVEEVAVAGEDKKETAEETSAAVKEEFSLQKYTPKNEEEKRICNYLDWQLASLGLVSKEKTPLLLTSYTIVPKEAATYEVVFDPFIINAGPDAVNIAPIKLSVQLQGKGALAINVSLPESFTLGEGKLHVADNIVEWLPKMEGNLDIGSQRITAEWVEKEQYYSSLDTDLSDIVITGKDTALKAVIGSVISYGSIKDDSDDNWLGTSSIVVNDIDIADGEGSNFHLNRINLESSVTGQNIALMMEKYSTLAKISAIETADKPGSMMFEVLSAFDTVIQLWNGNKSKMVAQGLRLSFADDKLFKITEITGSSSLAKDHNSSDINGLSTLTLKDIQIGEGDPGKEGSFTGVTLGAVSLNARGEMDKIPEKFFENNWAFLQNIDEKIKNSSGQQPAELPTEARTAIADLLGLLAGYNADFKVKDIAVFPGKQMPQVNLDSAAISYGLDTTSESGGVGSLSLSFSGLQQQMEMPFPVPKAAKISFELSNIPSLTKFITNEQLSADSYQALLSQTVMNSGLTLKLVDSFIALSESKLNISGESSVDPNAVFPAVGALTLSLQNPEVFLEDLGGISAMYPQMEKVIAMYSALANRKTTPEGVTTDTLQLKFTQEGKILSNGKDVTPLFKQK